MTRHPSAHPQPSPQAPVRRRFLRWSTLALTLASLAGCCSQAAEPPAQVSEWRFVPEEALAADQTSTDSERKKAMMLAASDDGAAQADAMAEKKAAMAAAQADPMAEKKAAMAAAQAEEAGAAAAPSGATDPRAFLFSPAWARAGGLDFHTFAGDEPTHRPGGTVSGEGVAIVDPSGQRVSLDSLLGQPTVLVLMRGFYGNVCPYCTTYTAQMAVRYEEFRAAGVQLLVVYPTRSSDQLEVETFKQLVGDILAEEGADAIPFPVYLDAGLELVEHYNLRGDVSKPATLVVDAMGSLRYLYVGRNTADRPDLDRVLAEARKVVRS